MKRLLLSLISLTVCLLAVNAFARGPADKVTGDYTHGNCWDCAPGDTLAFVSHKLISGHEAQGNQPQKGFVFSWNDEGRWFEMNLTDTHNTCVNVYADGRVRTGGLVHEGNGPQVGRYFGLDLMDEGEPAYFADHGFTIRFSTLYYSEQARQAFLDWCETGDYPAPGTAPEGFTVWSHIIFQGNLQVHNSTRNGD